MVLKVAFCANCNNNKKMLFNVDEIDLDFSSRLPAPIYIKHTSCNQFNTIYLDSKLRISIINKGKEDCGKWKFVKSINSDD